jgi:hypothetical protein
LNVPTIQNTHAMSSADGVIFVLWGSQFDEAPATIFITEFRNAGLCVKVVGLYGLHIAGAHGLSLQPDIYLDDALRFASQTTCLIIPTTLRMLRPFSHDPRLDRFLAAIRSSGARVIVGGVDASDADPLLPPDEVEVYPGGEGIFEYARGLGKLL